MNRNELKICVIGCGVHSTANILSTLHMLGVPIAGVSARHMDRARSAAERFGIYSAYDDYRKMLLIEKPDAVFIITDQYTQAEITKECLQIGCSVFVEKPLGMNRSEAEDVAKVSEATGKPVMVGFMKRFAPSYIKLKEVMNCKGFGTPLSFTGMFAITSGRPGWNNEVYTKVGGIHYVDLMRHLFGEPEFVTGLSNTNELEVDNLLNMRFSSGIIGSMFFAGLPAWKRHWEEICVTGNKGFVKVNNMVNVQYHLDNPPEVKNKRWMTLDEEDIVLSSVNTSGSGGWRDLYLNGYVGEIEHFLECIANRQKPICNAEDNVKTMRFCDEIISRLQC